MEPEGVMVIIMAVIGLALIYATWKAYTMGSVPLTLLFLGTLLNLVFFVPGTFFLLVLSIAYFAMRDLHSAGIALVMIPVTIVIALAIMFFAMVVSGSA